MADPKNLVSQPPLTVPFADNEGVISKAWAIWFRDVYKRIGFKGGNSIDANQSINDQEFLEVNATLQLTITAVNSNTSNISVNAAAIAANTAAIAANTINITANFDQIAAHELATSVHGATGDVIGSLDLSTELLTGVVKQMALVADATASAVSVTTTDIAAAPGAYDQTYTDTVKTMSNELKADLNTLVTDVNNAITQINAIIANSKTSGQMNNV